jgi:hypothetical protein
MNAQDRLIVEDWSKVLCENINTDHGDELRKRRNEITMNLLNCI